MFSYYDLNTLVKLVDKIKYEVSSQSNHFPEVSKFPQTFFEMAPIGHHANKQHMKKNKVAYRRIPLNLQQPDDSSGKFSVKVLFLQQIYLLVSISFWPNLSESPESTRIACFT